MRQVGFPLRLARLRAVGNELLEVQGDFFEKRFEAASGRLGGQEPATELPLDLVEADFMAERPLNVVLKERGVFDDDASADGDL